jgi:hypothetical protein
MAKNIENFRDELSNLAKIVESIENSFIGDREIEITTSIEETVFNNLCFYLRNNPNDKKCVISIGSVNFTFLKK